MPHQTLKAKWIKIIPNLKIPQDYVTNKNCIEKDKVRKSISNASTVKKHFWKNGMQMTIWWFTMMWSHTCAESAESHSDKKDIINIM